MGGLLGCSHCRQDCWTVIDLKNNKRNHTGNRGQKPGLPCPRGMSSLLEQRHVPSCLPMKLGRLAGQWVNFSRKGGELPCPSPVCDPVSSALSWKWEMSLNLLRLRTAYSSDLPLPRLVLLMLAYWAKRCHHKSSANSLLLSVRHSGLGKHLSFEPSIFATRQNHHPHSPEPNS